MNELTDEQIDQIAAKPWPAGPFATDDFGDLGLDVRQCDGAKRVARTRDRETAEAIALALGEMPRLVALARTETICPKWWAMRDAIIAKIDAAGFDLPKVEL